MRSVNVTIGMALLFLMLLPSSVMASVQSEFARQVAREFLSGHSTKTTTSQVKSLQSQAPKGVFVTLSKAGQTRACWGSLYPQGRNLAESIQSATHGALTKEYRHSPIRISELSTLTVQVSIVDSVQPIKTIAGQNPLRDGLMLRAGSRSAVILPGEAKDAHYQLVMAKLKAGISTQSSKSSSSSYQLYRIRTHAST